MYASANFGERRSTGFFGKLMYGNRPTFLNAAVLYENMVVESWLPKNRGKVKGEIVAIYPKEGTFWSDHPVGLVNRAWVTKDHRDAAAKYVSYLMDPVQQKKAVTFGFRDPEFLASEPALRHLGGRPDFVVLLADLAFPDDPFCP